MILSHVKGELYENSSGFMDRPQESCNRDSNKQREEIKLIVSKFEKQPGRFGGVRTTTPYEQQVLADDSLEREFRGIRDAGSILIFGPGEATGELKKRLKRNKLSGRIVGIETVDKMTDRQISAKVRKYFQK